MAALAIVGAATLITIQALSSRSVSAARPAHVLPSHSSLGEHYLDTLKRHLTRSDYRTTTTQFIPATILNFMANRGLELSQYAPDSQEDGRKWPESAETMIGLKRLDNLHFCIRDVLSKNVSGDLIECGAWRGGATIFMRGALLAYNDPDRRVWVADSFRGLPAPDPKTYPVDTGDDHFTKGQLAIPVDTVRLNFARYGLLDDRVRFLVGWFKDTLPVAPIDRLAVLRVDADMYEGTTEALELLYSKVSPGGYVIIDDYALPGCRAAVDHFRSDRKITAAINRIDWTGISWQKP